MRRFDERDNVPLKTLYKYFYSGIALGLLCGFFLGAMYVG